MPKPSPARTAFRAFNVGIMLLMVFFCVMPFVHILFASVSDPIQLSQHTGILFRPLGLSLRGYELVFRNPTVLLGYRNTLLYVGVGTLINVLLTAMGAYALSRKGFLMGPVLMRLITFTMFFSGGLIPFYLLVRGMRLENTLLAMVLPGAVSVWNLILMRTAFQGVPDSIIESAKLDGANDFSILFRIVLPLSTAVLAVMILFYAVGHWNSWFNAMLFLQKREMYPLQLILREVLVINDTSKMMSIDDVSNQLDIYRPLVKYCTIVVSTLPILLIYPFLQRYFVSGVMVGSIKG